MSVSRRRLSPFAAISGTVASAAHAFRFEDRSHGAPPVSSSVYPSPRPLNRRGGPSVPRTGASRGVGGRRPDRWRLGRGRDVPDERGAPMKWRKLRRRPGGVIDRRGQASPAGYGGRGLGGIPLPVGGGIGAVDPARRRRVRVPVLRRWRLRHPGQPRPRRPGPGARRRVRSGSWGNARGAHGRGGRRHPGDVGSGHLPSRREDVPGHRRSSCSPIGPTPGAGSPRPRPVPSTARRTASCTWIWGSSASSTEGSAHRVTSRRRT